MDTRAANSLPSMAAGSTQVPPLSSQFMRNSGVTWRSLIVGTLGVIAICALAPFNDFVLSDTPLTAGFLPLAAVFLLFFIIVAINAPLHRLRPDAALRSRELAVVVLMLLIACAIPGWGLMRFLIPMPVAPFHMGSADPQFWKAFIALDLPHWLFPVDDVRNGQISPLVQWFYTRVPAEGRIPWAPWVIPLFAWGVFIAASLA